jgi:hypothetical protein
MLLTMQRSYTLNEAWQLQSHHGQCRPRAVPLPLLHGPFQNLLCARGLARRGRSPARARPPNAFSTDNYTLNT